MFLSLVRPLDTESYPFLSFKLYSILAWFCQVYVTFCLQQVNRRKSKKQAFDTIIEKQCEREKSAASIPNDRTVE